MKKLLVLLVVALVSGVGCNKEAAQNPDKPPNAVADDKVGVVKVKEPDKDEKKLTPRKEEAAKVSPLYKTKPASFWIEQLKDRDASFRLEAVNALAEIAYADKRFVPDFVCLLKHEDGDVRNACGKALEKCRDCADSCLSAFE